MTSHDVLRTFIRQKMLLSHNKSVIQKTSSYCWMIKYLMQKKRLSRHKKTNLTYKT